MPTSTPLFANAPYFIVQKPAPERTSATASVTGTLIRSGRCLRLQTVSDNYLMIWPPGVTMFADGDKVMIHDPANPVTLMIGSPFQIDGGEAATDADRKWLSGLLAQPLPDACPGPYWIGGTATRPDPSETVIVN